jgi:hypothetical protein
MHWLEIAAIIFGLLGFAAMGAVLAYRLYHNPLLLTGLVPVLWRHVKPLFFKYIVPYFTKRIPPEEEAEYRRAVLAGRGDEWLRDRMRRKRRP